MFTSNLSKNFKERLWDLRFRKKKKIICLDSARWEINLRPHGVVEHVVLSGSFFLCQGRSKFLLRIDFFFNEKCSSVYRCSHAERVLICSPPPPCGAKYYSPAFPCKIFVLGAASRKYVINLAPQVLKEIHFMYSTLACRCSPIRTEEGKSILW